MKNYKKTSIFVPKKLVKKQVEIDNLNLIEIYGINDENLNVIRKYFPSLKIIARGHFIKLIETLQ